MIHLAEAPGRSRINNDEPVLKMNEDMTNMRTQSQAAVTVLLKVGDRIAVRVSLTVDV